MNMGEQSAIVIALLAVVFLLILFIAFMVKVKTFRDDLEYVNMEIRRNTGAERKHWQRKRRKLWLSMLFGIRAR